MNILHIVPTYRPAFNRGGPIVSVHNMNKWLVKKGARVTVYTTDIDIEGKVPTARIENGRAQGGIDVDGVIVYYFHASFPRIWEYWRVGFLPMFLPRHWEYSRDLHRALKRTAILVDIIHITSTFLFASALGVFYARKYKKPCIISPRGNLMEPLDLKNAFLKRLYIELVENKFLKQADVIHFTVPREFDEYISHKLPLQESAIIPNGLDPEEINDAHAELTERGKILQKQWKLDSAKRIVLFVGRMNWKKGLDTLLPAFAEVVKKYKDTMLVLAGNDEKGYQRKIERWIEQYQIKKNVIFTGLVSPKDKYAVYAMADVFALSSYSENFAMTVVEAMYCGVPVVITKKVGVAPYIERAGAGIVVEKETRAVSDAIIKILGNPELARVMGAKGKQLVRDTFMMPHIADKWMAAYNAIIKK